MHTMVGCEYVQASISMQGLPTLVSGFSAFVPAGKRGLMEMKP